MRIPNSEAMLSSESCLPLTPDEERETIMELIRVAGANKKEGDVWFVISARWFTGWEEYVGINRSNDDSIFSEQLNGGLTLTSCRPGIIDNSELVFDEADGESNANGLRRNLQEGENYRLVPQEVWKKLHEWYKGGPELPRKLVSEGVHNSLIVEVYPLRLKLVDAGDNSQRTIIMSRQFFQALVEELYSRACTHLNLEESKVDIWDYHEKGKQNMLKNFAETLQEAQSQRDQEILVELKDDDDGIMSNGTRVDNRGPTGLHNLGNTCFMNSAIQCLVHTPKLVEFFLQDYMQEINKYNSLGMQGELAIAFGDLLRNLWSGGRASIAPCAFKAKLAQFAPQFSGYSQHDSQELLAFLLDGLHEELNRVINKPSIEAKDADDRPDEEFADECWRNHTARNDSIIVDIFQGQYKSTLVCPICSKISVTFDPFMYLSLPLPSMSARTMTVTVLSGDGRCLPMPSTVTVPKNGNCRDLSQALTIECGLASSEDLLLAEVFESEIYKYLEFYDSLAGIKDEDRLVAYRLPTNYKELLRLEVMHRKTERLVEPLYNFCSRKLIGTPLMTCLSKDAKTGADIRSAVCTLLSPLLRAPNHTRSKVTGYSSSLDGIVREDDSNIFSSDAESSNSLVEIEEEDDGSCSFQLILTDEKGNNRTLTDDDSIVFPGPCIRVVLEWSDKINELYDVNYLVDLPEVHKSSGDFAKETQQEAITLFSCLDAFLKEEPLGPDDMWCCRSCKVHSQAFKKLDLWRLPEILVVHLKRFSYSQFLRNKLDTFVNFPVHNLDLSEYVKHNAAAASQSHIYELYAVDNHYGGLGSGHYTAYAKSVEGDSWYHFNDSLVSPASQDSIETSAAYLLFYRRV